MKQTDIQRNQKQWTDAEVTDTVPYKYIHSMYTYIMNWILPDLYVFIFIYIYTYIYTSTFPFIQGSKSYHIVYISFGTVQFTNNRFLIVILRWEQLQIFTPDLIIFFEVFLKFYSEKCVYQFCTYNSSLYLTVYSECNAYLSSASLSPTEGPSCSRYYCRVDLFQKKTWA